MRESIYRGIGVAIVAIMMLTLGASEATAQYFPERRLVREGNDDFAKRNFRSSLNRYNEALEHDSTSYEALYNRANAYHQLRKSNPQDSTLTAEVDFLHYEDIAGDMLLSKIQRAEVLRNLGESLFAEGKYEAALNSFRESLLLNPDDKEVKYDYILTKRIVDQKRQQPQNQQQNQNNDQNDQNQDQNQQNNDQNQQNQDQNQDQNQEGDDNQQGKDNQPDNNEGEQPEQKPEGGDESDGSEEENESEAPRPEELSSDKERMLDAIQAEEDKTQDKLKDEKRAIVIPGKKNW